MTISKSIIDWLLTFSCEGQKTIQSINTDIQGPDISTYALIREPEFSTKQYIEKKEYTSAYKFSARLESDTDEKRISNHEWGCSLEQWILEQNALGNLPVLEGASVREVFVEKAFCIIKTENNSSLYELTLKIKYMKEK